MLGKVEICGVNTAKLPSLSAQETDELLRRVKEGDQSARERLVEGNLRLVLSVIQRFSNRGENADDLFQVGCVGLLKAIDNFDVNLNLRFSTYGVPMIVGEIRRFLRDDRRDPPVSSRQQLHPGFPQYARHSVPRASGTGETAA